jgi:hypothetical protein
VTSALKICPSCSSEYPANERFCPRDGTALRSQGGGTDLVGSIIAERYHVIRKLGEGGMGQVYLAEHVKMGRKSAVKVMNPGMVHDADAISRFNREAANASRINHPNVAGIYDFGETPDGLIYLAMEFIEGESLTALVESTGALPAMRAARITKQAADGLAQAHDLGIVHRDLKPDNIMIAKNRDGSDCVKVVDFGIAKAAGSEAQKVTRTGMVVGTPEYMSPEQLAGDKLDPRSDIYSLALVAFNMLTGKLPFPSETAQESMIMRLTDRPKRLADMNASVAWPQKVQDVMDKALERDVALRYQSASQFGDALYLAIESMPRNAMATDGTMILDARSLPPTRLGAAAPGPAPASAPAVVAVASAPVAASAAGRPFRGRLPVLLGGGGLVAAAVIGALVFMPRSGGPSVVAPSAAPLTSSSGNPAAPVATSAIRVSLPSAGTAASSPGVAGSAAGGGRATAAAAPAAGAPMVDSASIEKRLKAIDRRAESEATAGQALAEANAMTGVVTTKQQRAYLGIIIAQAYGTLGQDARSCAQLRELLNSAQGTASEERLKGMIKFCP